MSSKKRLSRKFDSIRLSRSLRRFCFWFVPIIDGNFDVANRRIQIIRFSVCIYEIYGLTENGFFFKRQVIIDEIRTVCPIGLCRPTRMLYETEEKKKRLKTYRFTRNIFI